MVPVLQFAQALGFEDFDGLVVAYYTGRFRIGSTMFQAQEASRKHRLQHVLKAVQDGPDMGSYQDGAISDEEMKTFEQFLYGLEELPLLGPVDSDASTVHGNNDLQSADAELDDEAKAFLGWRNLDRLSWKAIAAVYKLRFGREMRVPALQMRYKRLLSRHPASLTEDMILLKRAQQFWYDHKFDIISQKVSPIDSQYTIPG